MCEISGVTVGTVCDLWLTLSGPLSGAGKALCAAACVWMTMENQSHYAPQPRPQHSGHCRLHLASWFMDAILCVCGGDVVSKASICTRPNMILKGTWWRCVLYARVFVCSVFMCLDMRVCVWIERLHLSFCQVFRRVFLHRYWQCLFLEVGCTRIVIKSWGVERIKLYLYSPVFNVQWEKTNKYNLGCSNIKGEERVRQLYYLIVFFPFLFLLYSVIESLLCASLEIRYVIWENYLN